MIQKEDIMEEDIMEEESLDQKFFLDLFGPDEMLEIIHKIRKKLTPGSIKKL